MLEGEFASITRPYKTAFNFFPRLYTWGKPNVSSPDTYSLLSDFVELTDEAPKPV